MNTSATDPHDIIIVDETEPCPYLEGMIARMPLRMPFRTITPEDADRRLAAGHRRTGKFVYQTNCPTCQACQPLRIDVTKFSLSHSLSRTVKRGDQKFSQVIGSLDVDPQRVDLFNKHRTERGLASIENQIDSDEYRWGFVKSCFDSFEIAYYHQGQLVCLAICDTGQQSLSAVYTYYDPDLKSDSLGTYSILKQIEFCRTNGLRYLYLGYFVDGCGAMQYKARFVPHERRIDGQWVEFTLEQKSLSRKN